MIEWNDGTVSLEDEDIAKINAALLRESIKFKRIDPNAVLPHYRENDSLICFYACGDHILESSCTYSIPIGFEYHIPEGYVLEITSVRNPKKLIMPYSSEFKTKYDSDREPELKIHMAQRASKFYHTTIKHGELIAVGVLKKTEKLDIVEL